MPSRSPEISLEQITTWLRSAAAEPVTAAANNSSARPMSIAPFERSHPGFDFKKARQSLERARTKNNVKTPPPFQRLRRNQAAVNESLIDTCGALMAANKLLAGEIAALAKEVAHLGSELSARDAALAEALANGARQKQKETR